MEISRGGCSPRIRLAHLNKHGLLDETRLRQALELQPFDIVREMLGTVL